VELITRRIAYNQSENSPVVLQETAASAYEKKSNVTGRLVLLDFQAFQERDGTMYSSKLKTMTSFTVIRHKV